MKTPLLLLILACATQLTIASQTEELGQQDRRELRESLRQKNVALSMPDYVVETNDIFALTAELQSTARVADPSWQQKPLPLRNLCIRVFSINPDNRRLQHNKYLLPKDLQQDLATHALAQSLLNKVMGIFSNVRDTPISMEEDLFHTQKIAVYYGALEQAIRAGANPSTRSILNVTLKEIYAQFPVKAGGRDSYYAAHRLMLDPAVEQPIDFVFNQHNLGVNVELIITDHAGRTIIL
jgi:hypothetical protein